MDLTSHSKGTITEKLLRYAIAIPGPVSRAYETLGKDLGNIRPIRFVVECIFGVALWAQAPLSSKSVGTATVKS